MTPLPGDVPAANPSILSTPLFLHTFILFPSSFSNLGSEKMRTGGEQVRIWMEERAIVPICCLRQLIHLAS